MRAAGDLIPRGVLRPVTYQTLIGLLASTGLRVCEALKLDRTDVNLTHHLLTVRETKFHKSRLVPVHESVTRALSVYARSRDSYHLCPRSGHFLLSEQGTALLPSVVRYTFQKLRRALSCGGPDEKPPRAVDLRHTFACQRLFQWYREGIDVQHAILSLSTYLGHVKVTDTYWYRSDIPELLAIAAQRFENFSCQSGGSI